MCFDSIFSTISAPSKTFALLTSCPARRRCDLSKFHVNICCTPQSHGLRSTWPFPTITIARTLALLGSVRVACLAWGLSVCCRGVCFLPWSGLQQVATSNTANNNNNTSSRDTWARFARCLPSTRLAKAGASSTPVARIALTHELMLVA